ncbi:major royal jelly protein 1 [Copidosoma floridanum]|uniref:major royal jelly protein 1 n=1 Tax=Copidosoma floridanum TaxID=29053 RepID=UPI0006C9D9CC|nr:major royal jelly protein 1 [Copidosoma floridanum]
MYVAMNRFWVWTEMSFTLAVVLTSAIDNGKMNGSLEPYPDWDMQNSNHCSSFQSVQSMEIDLAGRMWLLDSGLYNRVQCSASLMILDLEDGGRLLTNYTFPAAVASPGKAKLDDMVLDHEDGGFAYIIDNYESSLIVFSLRDFTSWKIEKSYVDVLALSPASRKGHRVLYYVSLFEDKLLEVPTHVLKTGKVRGHISQVAKELAVMAHTTTPIWTGMTMSNTGSMFLTAQNRSIYELKSNIVLGDSGVSWSFASQQKYEWTKNFRHSLRSPTFDEKSNLWFIGSMFSGNLASVPLDVKMKNYQYYENGTAPKLPFIAD